MWPFYFLTGILVALCFHLDVEAHRQKSNLNDWIAITPKADGKPWPLPQKMTIGQKQFLLEPRVFSFQYAASSRVCELLSDAFNRYYAIIFSPFESKTVRKLKKHKHEPAYNNDDIGVLKRLTVFIENVCEDYPTLDSDESCIFFFKLKKNLSYFDLKLILIVDSLQITNDQAYLNAKSLWGVLRGLGESLNKMNIKVQHI
jgi:hypothetical protein